MKDLMTGDILHCMGNRWTSKAIRLFTQSKKYTHTATVLRIDDELFIADSQMDGTQLRPFDSWMNKYNYAFDISRNTQLSTEVFKKRVLKKVGVTPYDFGLFLGRYPEKIIKELFTRKEVELREVKAEGDKMICSEFVGYCLGLLHPENYTPKDIYNYCMENNFIFVKNS
jgi:hypothetical protein